MRINYEEPEGGGEPEPEPAPEGGGEEPTE